MTSLFTATECARRAETHLSSGLALFDAEDAGAREWAAVALFYSVYHRARAAMLDDPIFGDVQRLSRANPKLTMEDRKATHHQGRKGGRGEHHLGVSEIVTVLYPLINADYRALHQASIQVRYGSTLVAPLDDLRDRCRRIHSLAAEGRLVGIAA